METGVASHPQAASVVSERSDESSADVNTGLVTFVLVLVVLATVPWRSNSIFSGGLDPVVAAKALLTGIALVAAGAVWGDASTRQLIRTPPVVALATYLALAVFGAWSAGNMFPGVILAGRIASLAVVLLLLATSVPYMLLLDRLFVATTAVALFAAFTGINTIASGRLEGGFPGIHSNELATLCAISLLGGAWRILRADDGWSSVWLVGLLVVILWATGSRSSFIAAAIGIALMLTHVRRLPAASIVALHLAAIGLTYIVLVTDLFTSFLSRGEEDRFSTLTSRTIAWSAAFDFSDSVWVRWFGAGLSVKEISVSGQYWNTQVLDSSWISSLVQAGRVGAVLLIVWAIWAIVVSRQGPPRQRMLLTPLLVYLVIRSTLESGLVDSSVAFSVFFTASVVGERTVIARQAARFRIGARTGELNRALEGPAEEETEEKFELINVNLATLEELQRLPGIGPATAVAIVTSRERDGDFISLTDLDRVDGIGQAKLAKLVGRATTWVPRSSRG